MSWFTFINNSSSQSAPVRREIIFPNLTENLADGDWLHVNLDNLDVGRVFYYEDGLIKNSIDSDSYLVVYETVDSYTPTYSLILNGESSELYKRNLWFKSVSAVSAGNQPEGKYYIYYHKDNIQYISGLSGLYQSTTPPDGANFIASQSGSSLNSINFYSLFATGSSANNRISAISYFGDSSAWVNQSTSAVGAKAFGVFSGPNFKLFAKKGPDCGFIRLKIIKTSAAGDGQKVVKSDIDIDLYSPISQDNQNIYSLNIEQENLFFTYAELYGDFSFEIEVLSQKNSSSTGNRCELEGFSFSKNYELTFNDEEIKSDIAFKSVGGLK